MRRVDADPASELLLPLRTEGAVRVGAAVLSRSSTPQIALTQRTDVSHYIPSTASRAVTLTSLDGAVTAKPLLTLLILQPERIELVGELAVTARNRGSNVVRAAVSRARRASHF